MIQHYRSHDHGTVQFIDHRETVGSALCQPRDIEIIDGPKDKTLIEEIAVDIRIAQGANPMGVRKNLKWS